MLKDSSLIFFFCHLHPLILPICVGNFIIKYFVYKIDILKNSSDSDQISIKINK